MFLSLCFCCFSEPVVKGKKAREREGKWLTMLSNWDLWMEKYESKVRHYAWAAIVRALYIISYV